jgi:type 1 fimbria pilin
MKAVQKTILASLLALSIGQAMAADSIDVKVIGTIVPAACTPALTGGATIDYGKILAGTIPQDDYKVLDIKTRDFSISCDAPTKVALQTTDMREGTNANPIGKVLLNYSIGSGTNLNGLNTADGKKIGAYAMQIANSGVKLDGSVTPDTITSKDTGKTWTRYIYGSVLLPGIYSWAKSGELTPVAFTNMTGTLRVQAAINKGSELDLTKEIKLDGLTTIELVYL